MARETLRQTDHDPLYTPERLSERLRDDSQSKGPSPRTLEKWRKDGDGPPYIKVGHFVRYRESAVQRWLDQQTRTHTKQEPPPDLTRRHR